MGKDTASCFICSYHQQHASCHQYCHLLFKDVWRYLKDINSPTGRSRGHVSGTCAKASFTLLPPFSGNGCFYFCKEEGIWKTSYWNILQNGLWAVAGEFWIPGSWVSHYLGTTHTHFMCYPGFMWCSWSRTVLRQACRCESLKWAWATVHQIFSFTKSKSALSKTRQVEEVEGPTLRQRYLIYSHIPAKLITHLHI